ncbi:unnamed protein product [Bartonella choladocola]
MKPITGASTKNNNALAKELLPLLEVTAGCLLVNGFATGVEVSLAMVHGGPFPSTSDGRSTSVGTAAIYRFLRPSSIKILRTTCPHFLNKEIRRSDAGVPYPVSHDRMTVGLIKIINFVTPKGSKAADIMLL